MERITIRVESREEERIDSFLSLELKDQSRSSIKRLIEEKKILVNDREIKSSYRVKEGDRIQIEILEQEEIKILPEDIELDIVYEDDHIAIINKVQGMVVYPAKDNPSGTLVNALVNHFPHLSTIGGDIRPGIVHRLDKDTSGLVLIAKDNLAHKRLAEDFKARRVKRLYKALVHGRIDDEKGEIQASIGRHPVNRTRMAVLEEGGREARTYYRLLDSFKEFSFLELELESGRTHQIRVHMEYINRPLVGDPVYSSLKNRFGVYKQMLHAYKIGFNHPISGEYMEFQREVPEYFMDVLKRLDREGR